MSPLHSPSFPASLLVAREAAQKNSVGEMKKEEEEEEDLSLAYAARGQGKNTLCYCCIFRCLHFRFSVGEQQCFALSCRVLFWTPPPPPPRWFPGFARYPMVGYIYKVNSTSSEEIWLWLTSKVTHRRARTAHACKTTSNSAALQGKTSQKTTASQSPNRASVASELDQGDRISPDFSGEGHMQYQLPLWLVRELEFSRPRNEIRRRLCLSEPSAPVHTRLVCCPNNAKYELDIKILIFCMFWRDFRVTTCSWCPPSLLHYWNALIVLC